MTFALAILPVVLLVGLMTLPAPRCRLPLPAHVALPLVATLAYLLQAAWFRAGADPGREPGAWRWIHAGVIDGVLSSLTPLAIIFGAVLLFEVLTRTGALPVLMRRLRTLSPDPVAQLMLVGWSFSFLVEGLSGFGTPAALAAPLLAGLGFPALRVAAMCLIMNSVPVSFGAVGTPIWFGLSGTGLSPEELHAVGVRAAMINAAAAAIIPPLALRVVVPWSMLRPRLLFVLLVAVATAGPYLLAARWTFEFPSIIGGLSGTVCGVLLARFGVGLGGVGHDPTATTVDAGPSTPSLARAVTPLLAVLLLLALTRLEPLGLRGLLNRETPSAAVDLGPLGQASVSPVLVVGLRNILGTATEWRMPLLYVPFIIPFIAAAILAMPLLGLSAAEMTRAFASATRRLARPALALAGALVLVKMLTLGGEEAPAMILGRGMAHASGPAWPHMAPLLGALGAFFSGSNTVSNLTFGPVQVSAANALGLDPVSLLALQTVGGALGNMVCVHNIVAVAAVLGLSDRRGAGGTPGLVAAVLSRTSGPMFAYAALAALAAALL